MPCNSDYLEASHDEREIGRMYLVHDEIFNDVRITPKKWQDAGYDKRVYNKVDHGPVAKARRDKMVREICESLSVLSIDNIQRLSLEAQLWWRDHQKADRERRRVDAAQRRRQQIKKRALAKLTYEERVTLGLA